VASEDSARGTKRLKQVQSIGTQVRWSRPMAEVGYIVLERGCPASVAETELQPKYLNLLTALLGDREQIDTARG
jgi:hypothetical protein